MSDVLSQLNRTIVLGGCPPPSARVMTMTDGVASVTVATGNIALVVAHFGVNLYVPTHVGYAVVTQ